MPPGDRSHHKQAAVPSTMNSSEVQAFFFLYAVGAQRRASSEANRPESTTSWMLKRNTLSVVPTPGSVEKDGLPDGKMALKHICSHSSAEKAICGKSSFRLPFSHCRRELSAQVIAFHSSLYGFASRTKRLIRRRSSPSRFNSSHWIGPISPFLPWG